MALQVGIFDWVAFCEPKCFGKAAEAASLFVYKNFVFLKILGLYPVEARDTKVEEKTILVWMQRQGPLNAAVQQQMGSVISRLAWST